MLHRGVHGDYISLVDVQLQHCEGIQLTGRLGLRESLRHWPHRTAHASAENGSQHRFATLRSTFAALKDIPDHFIIRIILGLHLDKFEISYGISKSWDLSCVCWLEFV